MESNLNIFYHNLSVIVLQLWSLDKPTKPTIFDKSGAGIKCPFLRLPLPFFF